MLAFTRRLIALRREHPVFRRRRWFQGRSIHGSDAVDISLAPARRVADDPRRLAGRRGRRHRHLPQRRRHAVGRSARRADHGTTASCCCSIPPPRRIDWRAARLAPSAAWVVELSHRRRRVRRRGRRATSSTVVERQCHGPTPHRLTPRPGRWDIDCALCPTSLHTRPSERSGAPLGPESLLWRIAGDWRSGLSGLSAGILQLMYPHLGRGVEDHSAFFAEPWDRINRSVPQIWATIFAAGRRPARASHIRDLHRDIKGTDAAGERYHALDPDTFWWAHATFTWEMFETADRWDHRTLVVPPPGAALPGDGHLVSPLRRQRAARPGRPRCLRETVRRDLPDRAGADAHGRTGRRHGPARRRRRHPACRRPRAELIDAGACAPSPSAGCRPWCGSGSASRGRLADEA